MLNYKKLATSAMKEALIVREKLGLELETPVCIYDAAEKLGVEVIFCRASSFEGFYEKNANAILLNCGRPEGRKVFTCGHELGHWRFKHGNRLDEDIQNQRVDVAEEYLANVFASHLLMPTWGVDKAFKDRGWLAENASAVQVFTVASQYGVSYGSLVTHMRYNMQIISDRQYNNLTAVSPKMIRDALLPSRNFDSVVVVDSYWSSKVIDIPVGSAIVAPLDMAIEGRCLTVGSNDSKHTIVVGATPGIGRVHCSSWGAFVRVSRKGYVGRVKFRHVEESEE